MNANKALRVFIFADLPVAEQKELDSAARLSTVRSHAYVFESPSQGDPDLYLVDGDLFEPQSHWFTAHAKNPAPTVFLTTVPEIAKGKKEFCRPLTSTNIHNLLKLLDRTMEESRRKSTDLCIGREDEEAAVTFSVMDRSQMRFSALVVDDSSTVRAQVGLGLRIFGVAPDFAESAEEAFALLASRTYDIAFLDVVLPGADGYQICKAIKKNDRLKKTTVIMLTSKSSTIDRVKASLAGCDTFLTKPVENTVFQQLLAQHLGGTSV